MNKVKRKHKYICSKCKSVWTSMVPLEFCVCGEKITENFSDLLGNFDTDIFKKMNDMFGLGKK